MGTTVPGLIEPWGVRLPNFRFFFFKIKIPFVYFTAKIQT
jgi:hypothetical protein